MDEHYTDPLLASVYDELEPDRPDLEPYVALAGPGRGRCVVDLGCGTGTLALLLTGRGWRVTGIDPAAASLAAARAKPGASRVAWVEGDASVLGEAVAELVTMTGNAAQAVVEHAEWIALLAAVRRALVPGGRFVFETRVPAARAWERWTPEATRATVPTHLGPVTTWTDVPEVRPPVVTYRAHFRFEDGTHRVSTCRLRFRERAEIEADLASAGFVATEVGDAPDRPGLELVFTARASTVAGWAASG